jgi:hypothetical protein
MEPCTRILQPPRAVATASADPRDGLRQDMAAADPSEGRGADGARVAPPGGVALSRASVAAARGGCEHARGVGSGPGRWPERTTCVRMAGCEGVTRVHRAVGTPGWPFFLELVDLVAGKG